MRIHCSKEERKSLGLTLYSGGFAAVKEVRRLLSDTIVQEVEFLDVAEKVEPGSIVIHGLDVLEQNHDPGHLSSGKLLELYIGDVVTVRNRELGEETRMRLLSAVPNIIGERVDTQEILLDPSGELILPPLGKGVNMNPSITWKTAPGTVDGDVHVSYLTQGLDWEANYVLEIRGETFGLAGWIHIDNRSGADFYDARLKLMAGQVHRQGQGRFYEEAHMLLQKSLPVRESFEERGFADKHVYTLDRSADLLNGQSKQISFLSVQKVPFKKIYKVEKTSEHATVSILLQNTKENALGIPLPGGVVRVYELGSDGGLEFTGEDAISDTPSEEKVFLTVGEAFDVISESWETARERRDGLEYVTHRYKLRNGKQENIRVEISHAIHGQLWKMESSTHDYEIKNTSEVNFNVWMSAGKPATVEFTYQIDKKLDDE